MISIQKKFVKGNLVVGVQGVRTSTGIHLQGSVEKPVSEVRILSMPTMTQYIRSDKNNFCEN